MNIILSADHVHKLLPSSPGQDPCCLMDMSGGLTCHMMPHSASVTDHQDCGGAGIWGILRLLYLARLSLGGADKLMGLKPSLSPLLLHPTSSSADLGSLADSKAKWDYIPSNLKTHPKVTLVFNIPSKVLRSGEVPTDS